MIARKNKKQSVVTRSSEKVECEAMASSTCNLI